MGVIEINHLTKDYGNNKGIFDICIEVNKGEVYGYLGPNGAGKSTTMRHLMGFIKPQKGYAKINGKDCWKDQKEIQKSLGYLPGEIAFLSDMTGTEYINMIAKMRGMKDMTYANELLSMFKINPKANLKRMSKGMKQKIGIVTAFMHNPDVILLDEPTSGLDPLMQKTFIELVETEKKKGKTIILSSHIFEEIERTCDRIGIIRNGQIIKQFNAKEFRHSRPKTYEIEFENQQDLEKMLKLYPDSKINQRLKQLMISIPDSKVNQFIRSLSECQIHYLKEETETLEDYFMKFYGGENRD